jgi:predicted ester cyclase
MSAEEHKAIVLRFLQEVWGEGNLGMVDELVAQGHVHHLTKRDFHGPDGVKQLVSWFHSFLPDVKIRVKDLIAEGDRVVVYFTFSGTDTGRAYRDNPPSGSPVEYNRIDIFRVRDGRIVERWGIVDTISMLHQIGAIS